MPVAVEQPFSEIPTLDWSLISSQSPADLERFLADLRHALVNVGFMYLSHSPVPQPLVDELIDYIPQLFALPLEEKKKISMLNSPHFLGYSVQGAEFTKGARDNREQFDFATAYVCPWKEGDPDWQRLWGAPQYPPDSVLPGFRKTVLSYLSHLQKLSMDFIRLMELALLIPPGQLTQFYDTDEHMQHRSKVVKYPSAEFLRSEDGDQGVGPHYDAGFFTFVRLLQASPQPGLQVQNRAGQWIPAPPVPGTFVVNIGKALETVTQKVAIATTHRVVSPAKGEGARYSVPFFQSIALSARVGGAKIQIPKEILDLKRARGDEVVTDSVNFSEYEREVSGHVQLIGRIKSHPDVGQKWYPHMYAEIFPHGAPAFGSVY
ncbi:Clavaminate synthase-like protein [Dacryopinax primogenitus]|uniref:Clavaminate synthase-like protein n=1 Tax=Dacryopinax primogenitus (strain DJM 731) TaxID=1858805 RepID=M5FZU3_DACPD|nr:Clavaminate synthase-like protein [Dacryopinax primogenitus]EJU02034.1 Clavaminate synthase-like protein [Dacryopinax primogenitus]